MTNQYIKYNVSRSDLLLFKHHYELSLNKFEYRYHAVEIL